MGNNQFLKKYSQELEKSIELLKRELTVLHTKIEEIEEVKEVIRDADTYRYGIFLGRKY